MERGIKMREITTSIYTFENLIKHNCIYVDKTKYIHKMLMASNGQFFCSRPRRFGKSLAISTLEAIFKGKRDLFKGLYLGNTDYDWPVHPVIHIDFANGNVQTLELLTRTILDMLGATAKSYGVSLHEDDPALAFKELISALYEKTGKGVVLLIDEYDKPILEHIGSMEDAEQFRDYIGNFYQIIKGSERYLRFTFITGVTKFAKVSIFSKLNNLDDISMAVDSAKVYVVSDENNGQAVALDLTGCPVLVKDSIVYVPINAIVSSGALGWSLYWDGYSGAIISTQSEISAASYFDAADSAYKAGLTAYIRKQNPKLSQYYAQTMMEYFRNYSEMYGIDEELMMAMAECESTFNTSLKNSHGCYGLMQIKASTGALYGYSASQLLNMKPAINTSVLIMRHNLDMFGGNVTKAVTAYNYGEYAVKRGSYKLGYYNKVVKKLNNIISYASSYSL